MLMYMIYFQSIMTFIKDDRGGKDSGDGKGGGGGGCVIEKGEDHPKN